MQSVEPGKKINAATDFQVGQQGVTADDIAKLLRQELNSYNAAWVRMKTPTITSTLRIYIPAPVGNIVATPIQVLSTDTNRYRVLMDAYSETGSGTFRLFLGQTNSDAYQGAGFRFDNSQSHPLQVFWGSDLYVGADPANTVGGYFNLIIERFR
jgi:hypothetical protein